MNQQLTASLTNFLLNTKGTKCEGELISQVELETLNSKIDNILPDWFIELLTNYPLAGAEFDYKFYEAKDGYVRCILFEFAKPRKILDETIDAYPGTAIKDLGYFCVGLDSTGSGNPFFTTNRQGDNPPIYIVYHDVSDVAEEIEKDGMVKVADSFSDLFSKAKIRT